MQRAGRVDDRRSCLAWPVRPVHSLTRFVLQYIIVRQLPVSGAIASTCLSYFRRPLCSTLFDAPRKPRKASACLLRGKRDGSRELSNNLRDKIWPEVVPVPFRPSASTKGLIVEDAGAITVGQCDRAWNPFGADGTMRESRGRRFRDPRSSALRSHT